MAAEPMSCCPPTRCALTPPGEYVAKGEIITVKNPNNGKDLRYYSVAPKEGKTNKVILVIHDIFGLDCGRHFGVCDSFSG